MEKFPRALEGVGQRSKNLGGGAEKTAVKVNHTKESLQTRLIRRRRKISDGGGVLRKRVQARTRETVSQELGFRDGKLTLAQANHQAMSAAQLQDVREMLGSDPSSSGRCSWRS